MFVSKWFDEAMFKLNLTVNRHDCVYYEAYYPHIHVDKAVNFSRTIAQRCNLTVLIEGLRKLPR
jgi:hypothetical protein